MTTLMQALTSPVAQALGIALLHFVWQATVIGLLLKAALSILETDSARARYAAGLVALALLVIAPAVTTLVAYEVREVTPQPLVAESQPQMVTLQEVVLSGVGSALAEMNAADTWRGRFDAAGTTLIGMTPWLVALWLTGVLVFSIRFVAGLVDARILANDGLAEAPEFCVGMVRRLAVRLSLPSNLRIALSERVDVPAVVGFLRPVILVPASAVTGLSCAQLESVLAHELAHIRRHDYLINVAQSAIETLFFFHPAVWWVSGQVRLEREHCCDDLAVQTCGDTTEYLRALALLEEMRHTGTGLLVASTGGSLLSRVRRLAGFNSSEQSSRRFSAPAIGTLAAIVLMIVPLGFTAQRSFASASGAAGTEVVVWGDRVDQDPEREEEAWREHSEEDIDVDFDIDPDPEIEAYAYAYVDEDLDLPDEEDCHDARERRREAARMAAHARASRVHPPAIPAWPAVPGRAAAVPAPPVPPVAALAPHPNPAPLAQPAPPAGVPMPAAPPAPPVPDISHFEWDSDELPHVHGRATAAAWDALSRTDVAILKRAGLSREYVAAIAAAGVRLSFEEAAIFSRLSIDPDWASQMNRAFAGKADAGELIALRAVGATPSSVAALRRDSGLEMDIEEVVGFVALGIDAATIRDLRKVLPELRDAEDFMALRSLGVSASFVEGLRNAGLRVEDPEDYAALKAVGVTSEWVRAIREGGFDLRSSDDAVTLRAVGLSAAEVGRLTRGVRGRIDADDILELRAREIAGAASRD